MPRPTNVPTVSQLGDRMDIEVRQGSTCGPFRHTIQNPDGTPYNLTGCTVLGKVRKSALSPGEPAAEFTIVYPVDRTLGYYDFTVADEMTATMPIEGDVTTFKWDMELINAADQVVPLLYGDFRVKAEVTREDTEAPDPINPCLCS